MKKTIRLNKKEVKRWLLGQIAANGRIEKEKVQWLFSITPQKSLEIYLGIWIPPINKQEPSYLLLAVRRALSRLNENKINK